MCADDFTLLTMLFRLCFLPLMTSDVESAAASRSASAASCSTACAASCFSARAAIASATLISA